ncbi:MAG: MFS transporter [Dactylosporangium sp.]|nr:MFS transporter [Dactylosporangium sp.]NNJ59777.1 MFS transporter [Dactylosporangium sp.]
MPRDAEGSHQPRPRSPSGGGRLRGGQAHRTFSVAVFTLLASLDNVAIGLVPPLYREIGAGLAVPASTVGWVTATAFLVSAFASVGWAYVGDRADRKPLLVAGTLIWAVGTASTGAAPTWGVFLAAQVVAAVGLGAVGAVGFSVVSDLIAPRRRGLVMSLWGLSQGVGTLAGTLVGGLAGADNWRRPFWIVTALGLAASAAYLLTYDIRRGQSEPELAKVFAEGGEYTHRISLADLRPILARRTNVWLIAQGLTAQVTFGSLVWLPQLFRARAEAQGYVAETATAIGSVYATLFQLGGVLSIVGGLIGDRMQRRTPRGRALVAAIGVLAGIPFYVVLFFVPFRFPVPRDAGNGEIIRTVLQGVVTEPVLALSLLTALLALGLTAANAPNWFALIADVNPPEHRGSVYSLVNLVNGVGRSAGNGVVGMVFRALGGGQATPASYAVGLAAFQVFFLPTALAFYLASRSAPRDIRAVVTLLRARADRAAADRPQ